MSNETHETLIDVMEIRKILPHRYPFLLVDRVVKLDLEKNVIIGQKNLTLNECFFQGHFPEWPIMPGVLMVEALAQVGSILAYKKGFIDEMAVLLTIKSAKFRRSAHPGDILYLWVEGLHFGKMGARVVGEVRINSIDSPPAATAEIACALVSQGGKRS